MIQPGQFSSNESERVYLYLGDTCGFVKVFDLTGVISANEIQKVSAPVYITNQKFYPFRKENLNIHAYAEFIRA